MPATEAPPEPLRLPLEPLLLPIDAAHTLSISVRALWSLTAPRGPIVPTRLGRSVRYSPEKLREFIANQTEGE